MEPVKQYRVYLAGLNANMANFVFGTCIAWSSPVMPKLRDHTSDSPLDRGVTSAEDGWISSTITLGAFCSCLIAGPLVGRVGRKWTLLSTSLFYIASFILLMFANKVWIIYVARALQGLGGGLSATALPMYIGEIATDNCRGALGSTMALLISGGVVYTYVIGPYVSYTVLQCCCLVVPIFFFATFIFMPDTPYFFATKGRKLDGIKSLQFLRGQSAKAVENEMSQIQAAVDEDNLNRGTLLDIFRSRGYKRALLICCGLLTFQQLSGTAAVTLNSQSIFSSAKTTLDPAIASIILGFVQFIANLFTPFVVERAGRRIILLISITCMCLALFALGAFFYVKAFGDASEILWLPVPALILFNVMYSFGFGPVPWAILGEMFPSNIKSIATSIATSISWLVGFVVIRWFPELNALGPYYAFWIFGSLCIVAFFFVIFVVIETKGLSLQKIQEQLHKKN